MRPFEATGERTGRPWVGIEGRCGPPGAWRAAWRGSRGVETAASRPPAKHAAVRRATSSGRAGADAGTAGRERATGCRSGADRHGRATVAGVGVRLAAERAPCPVTLPRVQVACAVGGDLDGAGRGHERLTITRSISLK